MKRRDAGVLGRLHQRPEAVVVDRLAEVRIELEGRIVGDAGQMDDGIAARQARADGGRVAQVALDLVRPDSTCRSAKHPRRRDRGRAR